MRREWIAGRRPWPWAGGLAVLGGARLPDAVLQVQPVLERSEPGSGLAVRAGARADASGRRGHAAALG